MNFLRLSWTPQGEIINNWGIETWPPPEDLWLVSREWMGDVVHFGMTPTYELAALDAADPEADAYLLTPLTRVSMSDWSDEIAAHANLARGAEYVIEVPA